MSVRDITLPPTSPIEVHAFNLETINDMSISIILVTVLMRIQHAI